MFRSIPVANKICFDKDLKRKWRIHERKLRDLKCSLDMKKPQHFDFLASKPKREELEEARNTEIMRENQVLLNKISTISVQGNLSKELKKCKSVPLGKTLNQPFRKKNLQQITLENLSMLRRIQDKKSSYNIRKMAQQRHQVEKNIHLISLYPYKDYKKNKTQVNMWMTNFGSTIRDKTDQSMSSQSDHKNRYQPETKKTVRIGDHFYMVTCFFVNHQFTIEMQNLEDVAEKYILEMHESQACMFLSTYYENSVEKLINALTIDAKEKTCYLKYEIKDTTGSCGQPWNECGLGAGSELADRGLTGTVKEANEDEDEDEEYEAQGEENGLGRL